MTEAQPPTPAEPAASGRHHRYFPEHGLFPVEFSGGDSNGHHAAYFVKPDDADSSKYRLHLAIRNVGREPLTIPALAAVSATDHHLRLRFRPGLVEGRTLRKALPLANELEQQMGRGWRWHDLATDAATGEISVCFSYAPTEPAPTEPAADFEWQQGQTLGVQLRPFQNAPQSGAFFLKVELDYGKLPIEAPDFEITAREINLAVVDLSGSTFFPGKAAVLGSNTILNNGEPNKRTIKLWNAVHGSVISFRNASVDHESGSTITVAIRCQGEEDGEIENHPAVLGTKNGLQQMSVVPVGRGSSAPSHWNVKPHLDVPGWLSWEITPPEAEHRVEIGQVGAASNGATVIEALELRLDQIRTTAPDGTAYVYLHFHHLPGLADHTLIVPLEKTPVVVRGGNVGVGTIPDDGDEGALHVAGALQVDGDAQVSGRVRDKTGEVMPVGAIIAFGGSAPPAGWLVCDGARLDPSDQDGRYRELCHVLPPGNTLPDLRSRFIVGSGTGRGLRNYPPNVGGGAETVKLSSAQMPSHRHSGSTSTDGKHEHTKLGYWTMDDDYDSGDDKRDLLDGAGTNTNSGKKINNDGSDHSHAFTTSYEGENEAHDNIPPYYALTYIIKY